MTFGPTHDRPFHLTDVRLQASSNQPRQTFCLSASMTLDHPWSRAFQRSTTLMFNNSASLAIHRSTSLAINHSAHSKVIHLGRQQDRGSIVTDRQNLPHCRSTISRSTISLPFDHLKVDHQRRATLQGRPSPIGKNLPLAVQQFPGRPSKTRHPPGRPSRPTDKTERVSRPIDKTFLIVVQQFQVDHLLAVRPFPGRHSRTSRTPLSVLHPEILQHADTRLHQRPIFNDVRTFGLNRSTIRLIDVRQLRMDRSAFLIDVRPLALGTSPSFGKYEQQQLEKSKRPRQPGATKTHQTISTPKHFVLQFNSFFI
ncbi:hypothetical protein LR48_Vigan03g153300 [Vigna angularis]|uniref:Uncharacterized protein n=1 Tax=Phaseolus angularis TaxID=3914 RepID=A0A0L9U5V3_PHAAN|nr:hypothetical protein LR48_Vigan03g153300 [Vigna angularis]